MAQFPVPDPNAIAVDEARNLLYVASKGANALLIVDGQTHTILDSLPVGLEPFGVTLSPTADKAYVANWSSGSLSVVDTSQRRVVSTIDLGAGSRPAFAATSEAMGRVYVPLHGQGQLAVIDCENDTLLTKVPVGIGAFGVAIDEQLSRAAQLSNDSIGLFGRRFAQRQLPARHGKLAAIRSPLVIWEMLSHKFTNNRSLSVLTCVVQ